MKTIKAFKLFLILTFSFVLNYSAYAELDDDFISLISQLLQEEEETVSDEPQDPEVLAFLEKEKKIFENRSKQVFENFKNHIKKYHFLVFPTCENFLYNMTPEDIAQALRKIIDTIAEKPWVYLADLFRQITKNLKKENHQEWKNNKYDVEYIVKKLNEPKLRKFLKNGGGHWEFICDQLAFYHEFIKAAKVDPSKNQVYLKDTFWEEEKYFALPYEKENLINKKLDKNIKKYWEETGETIHYDLYELCFKYWSNLYLEEVLNNNLYSSYRFYDDLEEILENLENAPCQSSLKEYRDKYKSIQKSLKQNLMTDLLYDYDDNEEKLKEIIDFQDY